MQESEIVMVLAGTVLVLTGVPLVIVGIISAWRLLFVVIDLVRNGD